MRINGYRKGRFTKANASRLGKLGVAARAKKRLENPPDDEPRRVPAGELLGVMQWHAADGKVRRWVIRQGQRMNGIQVSAQGKTVECGWDWMFRSLRKKLATPKRQITL
jgi:hypothetical protein